MAQVHAHQRQVGLPHLLRGVQHRAVAAKHHPQVDVLHLAVLAQDLHVQRILALVVTVGADDRVLVLAAHHRHDARIGQLVGGFDGRGDRVLTARVGEN